MTWFRNQPRDTPARAWCHGLGWNSTSGILADLEDGIPIDLITSADHGSEKRRPDHQLGEEIGTYDFIPVFDDYLQRHGYPVVTRCRYNPKPETAARYADSVREAVIRLGLTTISESDIERMADGILGNMMANFTMPGIAFGCKSCSVKWKIEAQEPT